MLRSRPCSGEAAGDADLMSGSLPQWSAALLDALGRDAAPVETEVTGADPVLPTCFRVGEAAAAALVAVGVASSDLWELRGGRPQRLAIDVRAAAASLLSFALQRVPGVSLLRGQPATIGLFRTRDGGWIHLHGGFPHLHDGTLALLGCADDAAAIARAAAQWDAAGRSRTRSRSADSAARACAARPNGRRILRARRSRAPRSSSCSASATPIRRRCPARARATRTRSPRAACGCSI